MWAYLEAVFLLACVVGPGILLCWVVDRRYA